MRYSTCILPIILLACLAAGCESASESVGPSPPIPSRPETASFLASLTVQIETVEQTPQLLGIHLRWGGEHALLDGSEGWRAQLAAPADGSSSLRVKPVSNGGQLYRLWVPLLGFPPGMLELALLPHWNMETGFYVDGLDLLAELVRPFAGSTIRRWPHPSLRVALPPGFESVDYAQSCTEAAAIWNQDLGWELFDIVETGEEAEIVCTLTEETRLAYTKLLELDPEGRPLAMKIHLSPRWAPGAEKFVRRVYVHELGHALGLWGHTVDRSHIMNGIYVSSDRPHPDEIRIVGWLWGLPSGTNLSWYERAEGEPGSTERPRVHQSAELAGTEIGAVGRVTRCSWPTEDGIAPFRPRSD